MKRKHIVFYPSYLLISLFSLSLQYNTNLSQEKNTDAFRDYEQNVSNTVKEFYRINHTHQTLDFVLTQKNKYASLDRLRMSI